MASDLSVLLFTRKRNIYAYKIIHGGAVTNDYTRYTQKYLKLLNAEADTAKAIYSELYSLLATDFCPPFDRGCMMELALALYVLSYSRVRDKRIIEFIAGGISALEQVRKKDYGREDCSECISLIMQKDRYAREVYLNCIQALLSVTASRI